MAGSQERADVLLVEDNEDNRTIYQTVLEHTGYVVAIAGDGATGLNLIKTLKPSLVLLDVSMPELDGWQVCTRAKSDPDLSSVRIVMLTAHALASDEAMAYACGADGYLRKPVEPRKVVKEVARHIGPPAARA